uniref:Uncharacterized protein n=1 Tax=Prymnesium polylepis TaxID=72548 RepID=A0A7S4KKT0_9EUKA|eukprot:4574495-Prymnesium_polylepis.2
MIWRGFGAAPPPGARVRGPITHGRRDHTEHTALKHSAEHRRQSDGRSNRQKCTSQYILWHKCNGATAASDSATVRCPAPNALAVHTGSKFNPGATKTHVRATP